MWQTTLEELGRCLLACRSSLLFVPLLESHVTTKRLQLKTNKMSKAANLQELAVAPLTEETLDNWVKVSACMCDLATVAIQLLQKI